MKMKNKMKGMTFILGMALASVSLAEASASKGSTYVGVGYHMGTYDKPVSSINADFKAIKLEFGKHISQHIAIQASFLIPRDGDSKSDYMTTDNYTPLVYNDPYNPYSVVLTVCCFEIEMEMKNAYSVFIKSDLDINSKANVYGLLGLTKAEFEGKIPPKIVDGITVPGWTRSKNSESISYGIGIESALSDGLSINAEYISYMENSSYQYTAFNVGLIKRF